MTKVSQLISSPLINIYDIAIEGTIENALFNNQTLKCECFLVYDEEKDITKVVYLKDTYNCDDGVSIKNSSKLTLYESLELSLNKYYNPINNKVFTSSGKYMGQVIDIELKNGHIELLHTTFGEISAKQIMSFNDKILIIGNQKIYNFKDKKKVSITNKSDGIVSILDNIAPKREVLNYKFLLNRLVTKDIKTISGEIIVKGGSIITTNIINKLKYYGKLKELTLHSK